MYFMVGLRANIEYKCSVKVSAFCFLYCQQSARKEIWIQKLATKLTDVSKKAQRRVCSRSVVGDLC